MSEDGVDATRRDPRFERTAFLPSTGGWRGPKLLRSFAVAEGDTGAAPDTTA